MDRREYAGLIRTVDWGRESEVNRDDLRPGVRYHELFAERFRHVLSVMETALARNGGRALRVADMGCFPGVFGKLAKKRFGSNLSLDGVGIGLGDEFRQSMQGIYDNFYTAELDPEHPHSYKDVPNRTDAVAGAYDFVLAAEIIEHLYNPLHLLDECARLLRADGTLVITTPNVSYFGNVCRLLSGRSIYEKLERSHVFCHSDWRPHMRIYDRHEIRSLCADKGLTQEKALIVCHGEERYTRYVRVRLKSLLIRPAFIFPHLRNQHIGVFRKQSDGA